MDRTQDRKVFFWVNELALQRRGFKVDMRLPQTFIRLRQEHTGKRGEHCRFLTVALTRLSAEWS